nr:hypothetical protein [Tanacetum cinerariifolium]
MGLRANVHGEVRARCRYCSGACRCTGRGVGEGFAFGGKVGTCATLTKQVSNLEQYKIAQAIKITKLKQRIRRLEKKKKFKTLGLKRLRKGGEIAELDVDKDVTLVDADVQGRFKESQAKVYHLDLEHAKKVISMQDTDEAEPAEVEEVIKVVTAAKLMTKVVTTTATTITIAQVPKASARRKRRYVVIQDPEETATASVIVHHEFKSKDKGKGILIEEPKPLKRKAQIEQDEAFTRQLEAELNANINWNDVVDQVKRKEKQDNTIMRYHALKRKLVTEAHARKNMMVYVKNMVGFKMDFFKGMTYTDIRPIFEKHYNSIQAFLEKGHKEIEEEGSKRKSDSPEQRAAKKERIDEEEEELKRHLQIVMFLLVEKKYPLIRFTLEQMLNNVRLEVEEESEMSLDLLRDKDLLKSNDLQNYMPSGPDVEIDYSKFTYGPKQTLVDESDSKLSEYASCKSDSSLETSTSMPELVENASKVVCEPNVWTDAPIIEEHMIGNKAHLADYQEFKGGSVTFGGSNGRITGENQANKSAGPKDANNSAGTQAYDDQGANSEEIDLHEEHFILPIWSAYSTTLKSSGDKIEKTLVLRHEANDAAKSLRKEATHDIQNASTSNPFKYALPDDTSIPHLKDIYSSPSEGIVTDSSYDDEGMISQALEDESWVDVVQEELLQFQIRKGHRLEEGINYDEVFAPVARIDAIRIFLAFASYMGFIVYQMDVKSAFLYGIINEEVYVSKPPSFVDPKFPNKDKKDIMLFQVYVDDIIFGYVKKSWCDEFEELMKNSVKTASTPIETQKSLVNDEEAADVDRIFRYLKRQPKMGLWYLKVASFDLKAYSGSDYAGGNLDRKSITGGCQLLILWQCKKQTIVAISSTEAEYIAAAHYYGQVL